MKQRIRKICEELWFRARRLLLARRRKGMLRHLKEMGHKGEKIKVLFTIARTETFSSYLSIYRAMLADGAFDVSLMPMPRYDQASGKFATESYDDVIRYAESIRGDGKLLRCYFPETASYLDIAELAGFDYIFLGMPYSSNFPDCYRFDALSKIAKLVFIPYGYEFTGKKIFLRCCFDDILLENAYFGFLDSEWTLSWCKKRGSDPHGESFRLTGFPRFDLLSAQGNQTDRNVILWAPRWTTDKNVGNTGSGFMCYKTYFRDLACAEDTKVIIRPHPLMFPNYVKEGLLTEAEVAEYKAAVNETGTSFIDERPSYLDALFEAGIFVADMTSIVIEYFLLGKPVIYCGEKDDFNRDNRFIAETFYFVKNERELDDCIRMLRSGTDPKAQVRESALARIRSTYRIGEIGESIKEIVKDDYEKNSF